MRQRMVVPFGCRVWIGPDELDWIQAYKPARAGYEWVVEWDPADIGGTAVMRQVAAAVGSVDSAVDTLKKIRAMHSGGGWNIGCMKCGMVSPPLGHVCDAASDSDSDNEPVVLEYGASVRCGGCGKHDLDDRDVIPAGRPNAGKRRCWSCEWVER